jgi:hypothetical protein
VPDRRLTDLAAAVSDGDAVDWAAARERLSSSDQRIVQDLQTLSRLLTPRASGVGAAPRRPLSPLLQAIRAVSIADVVGGLVMHGLLLATGRGRPVLFGMALVFAASALMLERGGRDRRAQALAVAYWTSAAAFCGDQVLDLVHVLPDWFIVTALLGIRPEAFFPACLWDFAREFPRVTRFSRLDRVYTAARAAAFALGGLLAAGDVILVAMPRSSLSAWALTVGRTTGSAGVYWTILLGATLPALAAIAFRARDASGPEGQRARRFLYVIALAIGPVFAEVVAEGLIPSFARWATTYRWWLGWVVYPLLLALPLGTAYTVAARDVLDVRVVIHRGLRYLLTRWLILWGSVVPLAMLAAYLYAHRDQPLGTSLDTVPSRAMLWVGAIAIGVLLVRRRLVAAVDHALLPGAEAPAVMLAHLAEQLKTARTPIEIARTLAHSTERTLQADAEAYIRRDDELVPLNGGRRIAANSIVGALLIGARGPCAVGPEDSSYYHLLSEMDRGWILDAHVRVLLPIVSTRGEGSLMGMVALKERRNALRYSEDDHRFLSAAAASASLACEALTGGARDAETSLIAAEEVAGECRACGRVERWKTDTCSCGGTWRPASLPARLAERFEIVQLLGAGGMGVVYRASDLTLRRDVALKTIPRLANEAAARLLVEAQAMAAFSHQHIATLYGMERWRGTPVLVMEYMAGDTLASRLRRSSFAEAQVIVLMRQLARALATVHAAGLFHGDIKPSNIGFTRDDVPKFLDFGLTRIATRGSSPHGLVGTPAYMSPEVIDGDDAGPTLDLWALALVFLECLTGRPTVAATSCGVDVERAVSRALAEVTRQCSAEAAAFLATSLHPSPGLRPSSAQTFIARLPPTAVEQA